MFERVPRILVVEDDAALLALYCSALNAAGYEAIAAANGLEALLQVDENVPDAVVLDLSLPRLDGREVYRELAANPAAAHVPVIIVTGGTVTDEELKEFPCVLRKPIDVESLLHEIRQRIPTSG